MISVAVVLVSSIALVNAACDNYCSGHGQCEINDVCSCYDNWGVGLNLDSGDCSQRVCPFELAWIDFPNKEGQFHKYAECAGRGICDRTSGECQCFDGYEGKACARQSCPNACSGHGTCEYIQELGYRAVWNDYSSFEFSTEAATLPYYYWDIEKSRACVCDPQYADFDCSKRMCPYGTDVLAVRDNLLVSAKYQIQRFSFIFNYEVPQGTEAVPQTFAFVFKTRLNETFTTIPIVFRGGDLPEFANDIQLALLKLPNKVIDGVQVAANTFGSGTINADGAQIDVNITFSGSAVQGPQHPLQVMTYPCGNGCTPKLTGLDLQTRFIFTHSNYTERMESDFNSYECGRRGKCDYSTGLCECFSGYGGENCNQIVSIL